MVQTPALTIVALMNAMIGGTILVLPVIYMNAGILPSLISTIVMGVVNQISCRLCINHLASDPDLPTTLDRHSRGNLWYSRVYNVLLFIGNIVVCMLYFELIVIQWQTLLGSLSYIIKVVNAFAVIILVGLLKYFKFGTKMLGYGIISIATYLVFLIYVLATAPKSNVTSKQIPLWTWNFNQIFNALSTAFSIQSVFIPIIRKCKQQDKYHLIILLSFILGGSVYAYIGFTGSFGIINRVPPPTVDDAQTIEQYFNYRDPPVMALAAIYLIHLYSALPEYLMIGKKRLLNLFNIEEVDNFTWPQTAVVVIALGVCFVFTLFDIQLSVLLAINGSIIAFFNTFLVPVYIHLRCYYDKSPITQDTKLIQMQGSLTQNQQVEQSFQQKKQAVDTQQTESIKQQPVVEVEIVKRQCIKTYDPWKRNGLLVVNILLLCFGTFVFGYTVYTMATSLEAKK